MNQFTNEIDARDYPELAFLCWFRVLSVPLAPQEAWSLYRAGWRHVDAEAMTPRERELVQALADQFNGGLLAT